MLKKIFKKKRNKQLKLYVEDFINNHKDDYLSQHFIVDKKGNDTYLVVTYYKDNGMGTIHIFTTKQKSKELVYFNLEEDRLFISDIRIFESKNRGLGTKAISILEDIARDNNICILEGDLFSTDEKNRERQLYFYNKNGFTIDNYTLRKELI